MAKYAARGTTLARSTTESGSYTPLAQITNITGPELSRDTIDVSDLSSDWAEFVSAMADAGEVTLDLVFDPADSNVTQLREDLENASAGELVFFQIVWPTPDEDYVQFAALVTKYGSINQPHDGALTASATLKISGAPSWGQLAS